MYEVHTLSEKLELLSTENKRLKDKLQESETYSKHNNLKKIGIPEDPNESTWYLMDKLKKVLQVMELDLSTMLVDNIHKLPAVNRPRPLIVKFCSHMDREAIWSRRKLLVNTIHQIYIREHFSQEVEKNI